MNASCLRHFSGALGFLAILPLSVAAAESARPAPHRVFYVAPDGQGSGTLEAPMSVDEIPARIRQVK